MDDSRWRFDVEVISPVVLAQYMEFRGYSVRRLAKKIGCGPTSIAHIRCGSRKTIRKEWAMAIEKELNAPPGSLFVARVSRVSEDAA